jgi:uncharacterized protein YacL
MPSFELTPEVLSMIAGVILSLAFSYIPKMNTWFAALPPEIKRLIMLALLFVTSGVIFGLGCAGIVQAGLTCDKQGVVQLVWCFVLAVIANQGVYSITPQPAAVKQARFQE